MLLQGPEPTEDFFGWAGLRIRHQGCHSFDEKRIFGQGRGICQPFCSPGCDLVDLHLCDGLKFFFYVLPEMLLLCVVKPSPSGQKNQQYQHQNCNQPTRRCMLRHDIVVPLLSSVCAIRFEFRSTGVIANTFPALVVRR